MGLRRRAAPVLIAVSSLLALGSALFEESFVHTDDGCAVETHCLACRLAVANPPEAPPPPPAPRPPRAAAGLAEPVRDGSAMGVTSRASQPRAPPAA